MVEGDEGVGDVHFLLIGTAAQGAAQWAAPWLSADQ